MAAEEIPEPLESGEGAEETEEAGAVLQGDDSVISIEGEASEEVNEGRQEVDEAGAAVRSLGEVLDTPALPLILDVPMEVAVEVDRVQLPLAEVVSLQPGSVVQLSRVPGDPLDLLVNGRLVARGEIVVVNDVFAFRITEIVDARRTTQAANAA